MKKILAGLAVVIAVGVVYLINAQRPPSSPVRLEPVVKVTPRTSVQPSVSTILAHVPSAESSVVESAAASNNAPSQPATPAEAKGAPNAPQAIAPPAKTKKPKILQDPLARVALQFVGADPEADAYWLEAINDPTLPASERKDLIEDLNEEGFADPKHPTLDDLPLIASRLERLQWLWQYAANQADLDSIQEAYKDLVNMGALATGGGKPIN